MNVKFSEDIVPLTDMKVNPGKVVKRTNESHRPVLLTSRGRGVAVVQSLDDFEQAEEEKAFMRAIVEGLNDLDNNLEISLEAAKARLNLK
ncbi:MAG: type II toxin-antitoxin system Phd/YefM family antitoxin [Desulfuromonadales bacterium]